MRVDNVMEFVLRFTSHAFTFCGRARIDDATAKICPELYLWIVNVHGQFWHFKGPQGALDEHVYRRSYIVYHDILGQHVSDALPDVYQGRVEGLHLGHFVECGAVGGTVVVSGQFPFLPASIHSFIFR